VYAENDRERCFIEVKNVTMKVGDSGLFPDAVTTRGRKHLQTLIRAKENGFRAVMLYVIQRMDVSKFGPAKNIDPDYAEALEMAVSSGVEVIPVQAKVSPERIEIVRELPFEI